MNFEFENAFSRPLVGVDEVGRGPWAGPVFAACAYLNPEKFPVAIGNRIKDSKRLSSQSRQYIYDQLHQLPQDIFAYAVGVASVEEIDEVNILGATKRAMNRAAQDLHKIIPFQTLLVDGQHSFPFEASAVIPVIKGDNLSLSIATASILAKVSRDLYMKNLAKNFPHYGWESNAGYGTKKHQEGLEKYGITAHHRKSFKPIQMFIQR